MSLDKIKEYRKKYKTLNESYKPILVFHIGADAGFFSEYNNMILAILYCLEHRIQFKLYSKDANFRVKNGWKDFFEPFCEEVTDSFHSRYNYRYPIISLKDILQSKWKDRFRLSKWKLKFALTSLFIVPIIKKRNNVNLFTYEIFTEMRNHSLEKSKFFIPELEINGTLRDACCRLIEITWNFNDSVNKEILNLISSLKIPINYVGLHVRGGDKYLESDLYSVSHYIIEKETISPELNLFILTDDYSVIESVHMNYPEYSIYTFCDKDERGYFHNSFCTKSIEYRRTHLLKLFASIEIISKSTLFIGTYSSNPGMFLGCRMKDKMYGIDRKKWFIM